MSDWRMQYEIAANEEIARFRQASDDELCAAIRNRATGEYYGAWRALAARRPTPEICWLLYEVLLSERPYLDRYHCASALLQLLQCGGFEAVELSAAWPVVPANLAQVRTVIESQFGPPSTEVKSS
jgi:hypothetical protein